MIIKYQSIFLLDEGIDTRIHGIKLISESEKEPGLNQDLFTPTELIRYVMRAIISAIFFSSEFFLIKMIGKKVHIVGVVLRSQCPLLGMF